MLLHEDRLVSLMGTSSLDKYTSPAAAGMTLAHTPTPSPPITYRFLITGERNTATYHILDDLKKHFAGTTSSTSPDTPVTPAVSDLNREATTTSRGQ